MTRGLGDGAFGEGTFGDLVAPPPGNPINLHVKVKTATTATLEWDPQPDAEGFRLFKNGSPISSSWNRTKTTWPLSYNKGDTFNVQVVTVARHASITL